VLLPVFFRVPFRRLLQRLSSPLHRDRAFEQTCRRRIAFSFLRADSWRAVWTSFSCKSQRRSLKGFGDRPSLCVLISGIVSVGNFSDGIKKLDRLNMHSDMLTKVENREENAMGQTMLPSNLKTEDISAGEMWLLPENLPRLRWPACWWFARKHISISIFFVSSTLSITKWRTLSSIWGNSLARRPWQIPNFLSGFVSDEITVCCVDITDVGETWPKRDVLRVVGSTSRPNEHKSLKTPV
jgi:hypothetical protein